MTRGKFRCSSIKQVYYNSNARVYSFAAICQDGTAENDRFHRYTPSGSIEIEVDNPAVSFELGKHYYVDFTEAE